MGRFKTITAICLTVIVMMVAGNVWYLHGLYISIKDQTLLTVADCVRRADISGVLHRLRDSADDEDWSKIRLTLVVAGKEAEDGNYHYPDIVGEFSQILTHSFHLSEGTERALTSEDYATLDSLFRQELNGFGLHPDKAFIKPADEAPDEDTDGLWSADFSIYDGQSPIFTAYFSPLQSHILHQMAGIISTSAAIVLLMGFLIFYLLHWVGRLRTIEQMKDDFTHNMTHELKTPVAVAYSAADSMLRYYDQSDEVRNKQFLHIIMERLSYLSGMIENILSMSMERFKTMRLNMQSVALRPVVEDVAAMVELKARKPVETDIDVPDSVMLSADPLHLANLLSNIMDNAVKYSGESVKIAIKADGKAITIADNGIGIDRAHLPYIFDKFYRVSHGDCYETGGYGLGLFYVRQIVELHGWSIGVASRPGRGTVFTIRFTDNEKR